MAGGVQGGEGTDGGEGVTVHLGLRAAGACVRPQVTSYSQTGKQGEYTLSVSRLDLD